MVSDVSDLQQLRGAAAGRNWGDLTDILTRLFMKLEFFAALEIVVTRAYNHLAIFEAQHPESGWARSLLVWITSYGAAPADLPQAAAAPHPSPGASNYIASLIDLARAMERQTPLENRFRFLASALSNVILAELAAAWYADYPNLWEVQQTEGDEIDEETGLTVRQTIQAQFWLDDETAARDTSAWLSIADAVEGKIGGRR